MADFTYLVPDGYRQFFPGLAATQNQIYVGGDEFINDERARQHIAELTKMPIEAVRGFPGGKQNVKIGLPMTFALLDPPAFGAEYPDISEGLNQAIPEALTGDSSIVFGSEGPRAAVDVVPTASEELRAAQIDQEIANLNLSNDYVKTAKTNVRNQKSAELAETISDLGDQLKLDLEASRNKWEEKSEEWNKTIIGGDTKEESTDFWATMGADLEERGEALSFQAIIDNPEEFLTGLEDDDAKLIWKDPTTGFRQLNPWVSEALTIADNQAGYISKEQIALIENQGLIELAKLEKESQLELLEEEGASQKEITELKIEADKAIADINEANRIREFNYLNKKEEYQFQLQQRMQEQEYDLLVKQGEQSENAANRQHAELMKQFQIQQEQNVQQFDLQMQQLEDQRLQEAQQFELQQIQDQQQFELQQKAAADALAIQSREIERQIERDRVNAEANKRIAEIEKEGVIETVSVQKQISEIERQRDVRLAEIAQREILGTGAQNLQATLRGFEAQELQAAETAAAQIAAAQSAAAAAGPFGFLAQPLPEGLTPEQREALVLEREAQLAAIQQQQYNPYNLTNQEFQDLQALQAETGATPFGALTTAPENRYQEVLSLQQAQAAQGPFQAAQLGQEMADISTILRGGLTPTQQVALARAPGNPFGLTAQQQIDLQNQLARSGITDENEFMAFQNSLARGGLTAPQRLAEIQASAAPQNMANYLNFIGNPSAVGFASQTGMLQNIADSPEGNIPASLFGLNTPQSTPQVQGTPQVPVNPTLSDLTDLSDEQLGFYQGQMAAQQSLTPSQIFQQAQTVTPQGV
ncbi:MAG: hypothetical protein CL885_03275 [Dehalococcoidia bacterium]|nr:hypothetical protein [Dehalococcoidia bacterium]